MTPFFQLRKGESPMRTLRIHRLLRVAALAALAVLLLCIPAFAAEEGAE